MQIQIIKAEKKLRTHIAKTFADYETVKVRMHRDACSSIVVACLTNRADIMDAVHNAHTGRYANAYRAWVGKVAVFTDEEGNEKNIFSYTKKGGFRFNKGTADARLALVEEWGDTPDLTPFYEDSDKGDDEAAFGLAELYTMLIGGIKRALKKADDEEVYLDDVERKRLQNEQAHFERKLAQITAAQAKAEAA
jgi:hypothetical protein